MASQSSFETVIMDGRPTQPAQIKPETYMLYSHYEVVSKIGEGGYGAVYEVVDRDHQRFAMKVQRVAKEGSAELKKEFEIYKKLLVNAASGHRTPGIPWVYEYKEHEAVEYMVMERLGDSLDRIADKSPGKSLSKVDALMVGIQVVRRLRDLHDNGILHGDVKPENLAMGLGQNTERTVHILDFGLATTVEDWSTYEYETRVAFSGSLYYASTEALFHKAPMRKGDLEGLVYTLLCLVHGELPWVFNHPENGRELLDSELGFQRLHYKSAALCKLFPELTSFIETVNSTKREEEPDYEYLVYLLQKALNEFNNKRDDGGFRWLTPGPESQPGPLRYSENEKHMDEPIQRAPDPAIANNTTPDPLKPTCFSCKLTHQEYANETMRTTLVQEICQTYKATQNLSTNCTPPSRPKTFLVENEISSLCIPSPMTQNNESGDPNPLCSSNCCHTAISTLDLAERRENQTTRLTTGNTLNSSGDAALLASQQGECTSDFTLLLCFTLVMACYLDCRSHRNHLRNIEQIQQRLDDNVSNLQRNKTKKDGIVKEDTTERCFGEEVGTKSEIQDSVEVQQSLRTTINNNTQVSECLEIEQLTDHSKRAEQSSLRGNEINGTERPKQVKARSKGRSRVIVKKLISKGIGSAVRIITVPATSTLGRIRRRFRP